MRNQQRHAGTLSRCLRLALVAVSLLGAASGLTNAAEAFKVPVVVNGQTVQADAILEPDGAIRVTIVLVYRTTLGPTPPPPPPPPPPTPSKIVALYLVHESGDGTPQFTAIRNAAAWKAEADKAGIKWIIADKETAAPKIPQAVKLAVAKGLPAVVLIDAQGLGIAEKCPATPDAMLERVRKAGGK